jgi:chemotaxis protein methyltransferase CheR
MTLAAAKLQAPYALDGSPDPELVRIRDLIYQTAGIFHPDNKLGLLLERCRRRMKELKALSLPDYLECLTVKPMRHSELLALLNEITIGETCFFRNQPQLDALRRIVLPKLLAAEARLPAHHLRIWSAGCSTGEEPYTLAMLMLEEAHGLLKGWTVEILATDLNEKSLAHARNGVYSTYSTRKLTPYFAEKYFTAAGDLLQLKPNVCGRVSFSRLNLSDDARIVFMKNLDVIFCCNVLIYFDLVSKRRVIEHFFNNLRPHGYFFMGHSESLYGVNSDFRLIHFPGTTAYLKGENIQPGSRRL